MGEGNNETREQGAKPTRPQIRAVLEVRDDVTAAWRPIESVADDLNGLDGDKFAARACAEFGDKANYYAARAARVPAQPDAAPGGGLGDDGA